MGIGSPSLAAAGEGWGGGRWQQSGGNEGAHEIAGKQNTTHMPATARTTPEFPNPGEMYGLILPRIDIIQVFMLALGWIDGLRFCTCR